MQIGNIHSTHAAHGLKGPHTPPRPAQTENTAGGVSDQLDISSVAQAAMNRADGEGIRADRVAQLKTQIADGTYETADKLDAALDRLLDEIG